MPNKVYISGGITGVKNYYNIFEKAESELIQAGYEVVNPCKILPGSSRDESFWLCSMREDIVAMMRECNKVALLPNWYSSKGARVEYTLAMGLGFEVEFLNTWIERAK